MGLEPLTQATFWFFTAVGIVISGIALLLLCSIHQQTRRERIVYASLLLTWLVLPWLVWVLAGIPWAKAVSWLPVAPHETPIITKYSPDYRGPEK